MARSNKSKGAGRGADGPKAKALAKATVGPPVGPPPKAKKPKAPAKAPGAGTDEILHKAEAKGAMKELLTTNSGSKLAKKVSSIQKNRSM